MAIPTSRTKERAEIRLNSEKCNGCGLCISVCKDFSIEIKDRKVELAENPLFGCIACGHCMAICPNSAIEIYGRELSPEDMFELPSKEDISSYAQLLALLQRRRSIREFNDKDVESELVDKILMVAKSAPMGLPPSDVNVLVLNGKDKTSAFAKDFSQYLEGMKYMTSNWFLALMRPFIGKENYELFNGFLKPLFHAYTDRMKNGENLINYDAPLAMYFYGTPYSDPADPIVVATYAMIAAESIGLGTCMLGAVHPFIQRGGKAKIFREKHSIYHKSKEGLFVIFGHPKVKYKKGINRTLASITTIK
jgi:ferredoxin